MSTILFADDSESMRLFVNNTLTKAGYDVLLAEDGLEALEILRKQNKIDMILSDYNMPRMDGLALATKVRKMEVYKFLPIVIITTEGRSQKKQEARNIGATGWIIKPFDEEMLLRAIKRVIRN